MLPGVFGGQSRRLGPACPPLACPTPLLRLPLGRRAARGWYREDMPNPEQKIVGQRDPLRDTAHFAQASYAQLLHAEAAAGLGSDTFNRRGAPPVGLFGRISAHPLPPRRDRHRVRGPGRIAILLPVFGRPHRRQHLRPRRLHLPW